VKPRFFRLGVACAFGAWTTASLAVGKFGLAAAYSNSCALDIDGVKCWGTNIYGVTTIPALNHPVSVGMGYAAACVLDADGVKCWGSPTQGVTTVPALNHPVAVSAGGYHNCALDDDGVKCWGDNRYGESTVPALNHATQVSVGTWHTCALDADGVKCWGENTDHQTDVPTLNRPVYVSAGGEITCALDLDGVKCWGGSYITKVPALSKPTQVSAGSTHACAIDAGGLKCWGQDTYGQLNFPPLKHPTLVSAGEEHTCALDDDGFKCWGFNYWGEATVPPNLVLVGGHACVPVDGSVRCVGDNETGQLGNGDDQNLQVKLANAPATNLGVASIDALALGLGFTCGLADGVVKCWGRNEQGQLGLGDLRNRGNLASDMGTNLPVLDFGGAKITQLGVGHVHACALTATGAVSCWGVNASGQLGVENSTDSSVPVLTHLKAGLVAKTITAGASHTCLLSTTNQIYCFGSNSMGQLGSGHPANIGDRPATLGAAMVPVDLGADFVATAISAGANHTCALSEQGAVKCFGANDAGQLGIGDVYPRGQSPLGNTLPAVDFGHGQIAIDLACGDNHCCVRTAESTMKCWGGNVRGQLGLGDLAARGMAPTSMGDNLPFVLLPPGEAVTELSLHANRTCARTDSGLRCWGGNSDGELGLGDTLDRGDTPATLPRTLPSLGI